MNAPRIAQSDAVRLEARAHAVRIAMLTDTEFMDGVARGYEQAERDEGISLEELDRRLEAR